jgi:hypothetical protein
MAMQAAPLPASGAEADDAQPGAALLGALGSVPVVEAASGELVSYLDVRAVEAARPGAARPTSMAELRDLLDAGDPAAERWMAAMMGVAAGSPELLSGLFAGGERWPELAGFDFFDIERMVTFGVPPGAGLILQGDFDPVAVGDAFSPRGFEGTPTGDHTVWCAAAGCEAGLRPDLANADPANPFGGRLGRPEPVAVSPGDLLTSPDIATVEAMLAAAGGDSPRLADEPDIAAVAAALPPDALLVQAVLFSGLAGVDPAMFALLSDSPEEATELLMRLDEILEPMPAWTRAAIVDGATATEQVVSIALAYATEEDAAVAAEVLPRRLAALPSLVRDVPLADLLAERGVTAVSGRAVPAGEGSSAAAVVELRAPIAGDEPDPDTGSLPRSSAVFRLLSDMVMTRDLLWLAPVLPLE